MGKRIPGFVLMVFFLLAGHLHAQGYSWLAGGVSSPEDALENRIPVPPGFERVEVSPGSLAAWFPEAAAAFRGEPCEALSRRER